MPDQYIETFKLGQLLQKRSHRGANGDRLLSVSQSEGVIPQEDAGRRNISSGDKSNYWIVKEGDIVYNTMRMWQGASARSNFDGIVSPAYTVCAPSRVVSTTYLSYVLKLPQLINTFRARSQGITSDVWNLRFDEFARLSAPVVTDRRSRAIITDILSTVDAAIEHTEALIAKTQQVKAGLMHDLFTRGVLPNGELRPPREEAPALYKESPLGWIPKEWQLRSLGTVSEIVSGVTLNSSSDSGDIKVPYLRVANVQDGYLDLSTIKYTWVNSAQLAKLTLRPGDVLMSEGGDFDKLGRGTVWQGEIEPCVHQNHVFRVRPRNQEVRSHFLAYWSQSRFGKKYFVLNSKQSTNLASINSSQLHDFPTLVSNDLEQRQIEDRIGACDIRIQSLLSEREKLSKVKAGLMDDLLTGKVRVPLDDDREAGDV